MIQRPDISVIVPCYNAEKYLSVCLESLRAQKELQVEMIFINDGSTDATAAILDEFAAAEPRANVIHVENGGVSAARNRGLDMARGSYIAFVDADDALEGGSLFALYQQAVHTGAQIVSANHTIFDEKTRTRIPVEIDAALHQPAEVVREIIHMHRIFNNLWNKLYDASLFAGVRLDEQVKIGEDALLNLQLFYKARRIVHLSERTYVYRVHDASAMAGIRGYAAAHQPMLRSMNGILLKNGIKERYFRDFLQSCVWINERERGIMAAMRRFGEDVKPLVLDGIDEKRIPKPDGRLYRCVRGGFFPLFYICMRARERLTGRRWGIRR